MKRLPYLAVIGGACLSLALPFVSNGFQILPKISDVDRKLNRNDNLTSLSRTANWFGQFVYGAGGDLLKNPVHEAIALAALGCIAQPGDELDCVRYDRVLEYRMILYGVRWPDDPPFRLDVANPPDTSTCRPQITVRSTAQPACWWILFEDAKAKAATYRGEGPAFGPGKMLLYRSHFGDLQFMHAMASYDGETATQTRERMRVLARYMWGVAIGELRNDIPIRNLGVAGLSTYFPGEMTTTNLLATGIVEARRHLDEVALGVILHMLQDSFSAAHTSRNQSSGGNCLGLTDYEAPGRISAFNRYAHQDSGLHDQEDTPKALTLHTVQEIPNAVTASRDVLRLWREKATWPQFEKYFDCAFALTDPDAVAGPGRYIAH